MEVLVDYLPLELVQSLLARIGIDADVLKLVSKESCRLFRENRPSAWPRVDAWEPGKTFPAYNYPAFVNELSQAITVHQKHSSTRALCCWKLGLDFTSNGNASSIRDIVEDVHDLSLGLEPRTAGRAFFSGNEEVDVDSITAQTKRLGVASMALLDSKPGHRLDVFVNNVDTRTTGLVRGIWPRALALSKQHDPPSIHSDFVELIKLERDLYESMLDDAVYHWKREIESGNLQPGRAFPHQLTALLTSARRSDLASTEDIRNETILKRAAFSSHTKELLEKMKEAMALHLQLRVANGQLGVFEHVDVIHTHACAMRDRLRVTTTNVYRLLLETMRVPSVRWAPVVPDVQDWPSIFADWTIRGADLHGRLTHPEATVFYLICGLGRPDRFDKKRERVEKHLCAALLSDSPECLIAAAGLQKPNPDFISRSFMFRMINGCASLTHDPVMEREAHEMLHGTKQPDPVTHFAYHGELPSFMNTATLEGFHNHPDLVMSLAAPRIRRPGTPLHEYRRLSLPKLALAWGFHVAADQALIQLCMVIAYSGYGAAEYPVPHEVDDEIDGPCSVARRLPRVAKRERCMPLHERLSIAETPAGNGGVRKKVLCIPAPSERRFFGSQRASWILAMSFKYACHFLDDKEWKDVIDLITPDSLTYVFCIITQAAVTRQNWMTFLSTLFGPDMRIIPEHYLPLSTGEWLPGVLRTWRAFFQRIRGRDEDHLRVLRFTTHNFPMIIEKLQLHVLNNVILGDADPELVSDMFADAASTRAWEGLYK